MANNHKEWTRFFRFAIVGASGAVVDFGILNLFTLVFKVAYVPSSVVSFIMAVLNNFLWNRYWTYPDSRSKHVAKQLTQFAIINIIGLAIRTPLLAFLEGVLIRWFTTILPKDFLSPTFVGHNIGLAIAILVVMLWNYIANRYWTYNDVK
jgi:putative flippase GtrA